MIHQKISSPPSPFVDAGGDMFQNRGSAQMPKKCVGGFLGLVTLVLGLSLSPDAAYAGFEWVAPPSAPSPAPTSSYNGSVYVAPQSSPQPAYTQPEVISPVVISGDTNPSLQAPVSLSPTAPAPYIQPSKPYNPPSYNPPTYNSPVATAPQAQNTQPPAAQPYVPPRPSEPVNLATATVSVSPPPGGDIVQGFASEVPLALALRQILPVGYNFSIDQNVSMDTMVSYKGGKPWRDTVRDMLTPMGLVAHEQGSNLMISRSNAQPVSASAAPPLDSNPITIDTAPPGGRAGMVASSLPLRGDVPSMDVNSPDGWTAEHGETLRKVLSDWCRRAGVELQWLAEYDYPVEASAHFNGGFEDAVRGLLAGFETARPQPVGELHMNANAGQMVLVLQPRGNSYSN